VPVICAGFRKSHYRETGSSGALMGCKSSVRRPSPGLRCPPQVARARSRRRRQAVHTRGAHEATHHEARLAAVVSVLRGVMLAYRGAMGEMGWEVSRQPDARRIGWRTWSVETDERLLDVLMGKNVTEEGR
jgi:hypothetical protein